MAKAPGPGYVDIHMGKRFMPMPKSTKTIIEKTIVPIKPIKPVQQPSKPSAPSTSPIPKQPVKAFFYTKKPKQQSIQTIRPERSPVQSIQSIYKGDNMAAGILKRGSRGPDVQVLQEALRKAGYSLDADGIFGAITEKIVEMLQRRAGLAPDGIAGPNTLKYLGLSDTTKAVVPVEPVVAPTTPTTTMPFTKWQIFGVAAAGIAVYIMFFHKRNSND